MAGIFGGCQSLHTDSYDEAFHSPSAASARLALNTQNILREEAALDQVIDPLGGSHYLEQLTDQMEAEMEALIARIDAAGGMFQAAADGLVQRMITEAALDWQRQVDSGRRTIVGLNAYCQEEAAPTAVPPLERPPAEEISAQIQRFRAHKAARPARQVARATTALAAAAREESANLYEGVLAAVAAGLTHGEIVSILRGELGEGQPQVVY